MANPVNQYLARYAEPEVVPAQALTFRNQDNANWDYVLVIPAYRESADFFYHLQNGLLANHRVLLILVVNQPDNELAAHPLNTQLCHTLIRESRSLAEIGNLRLRQVKGTGSAVLLVDRFSPNLCIPKRQGVGLARKIGADIATAQIEQGRVTNPWIFSTDADTTLPADYFSGVEAATDAAGAVYAFRHRYSPDAVGEATRLYEDSLRYYVAGLNYAGSPYAFYTIGSTLAFRHDRYAWARGFPKRSGGEDFYLLNKLVKLGCVRQLETPVLEIESRISDRVPFGTGPAIDRILAQKSPESAEVFYHPEIFEELKTWLACTQDLYPDFRLPESLSTHSRRILIEMDVEKLFAHSRAQCKSYPRFTEQFHTWFDGFRTLKYIHGLRANGLSNQSRQAIQNIAWFNCKGFAQIVF